MKHIQATFQAAVEVLVGDGPVKKRLCRAFEEHLLALHLLLEDQHTVEALARQLACAALDEA